MSSTKPNKFIALVDCNNFYASCERVFNPRLYKKPVVILSNNDGCVIARSNEAKKLGIPMGAPFFKYREEFKKYNIHVFSSNFALYGDMSHRVMQTLAQCTPEMEIYSIDEAFLVMPDSHFEKHAQNMRQKVLQWVGIPVSVGVAQTKTLAKAANDHAKKTAQGVAIIDSEAKRQTLLSKLPVEDVWGIGKQMSALLRKHAIFTAWDFANADDGWIKKNLSVVGLRTAWELRGIPCLSFDEQPANKKSIVRSRSFGQEVTEEADLAEALSSYTAQAAEKLRSQNSLASYLDVFLHTSAFKPHFYSNSIQIVLPEPTDFTPYLIQYAKKALSSIYKPEKNYKKIGVMLGDLVPNHAFQPDLFHSKKENLEKQISFMRFIDSTNAKYGKGTLKFAAEGISQPWKAKRDSSSLHYTTCWDDLLKIKI